MARYATSKTHGVPCCLMEISSGRWYWRRSVGGKQQAPRLLENVPPGPENASAARLAIELLEGQPLDEQRSVNKKIFVRDTWEQQIDERAKPGRVGTIRPSSSRAFKGNFRRHVLPRLGDRRVYTVSRADIVNLINELVEEGLAPGTVKSIVGACSIVFNGYQEAGYRPDNPTRNLGKLRPKLEKRGVDRHKHTLSPDEIDAIIAELET